jgi:predicted Zn-dependent peptidase
MKRLITILSIYFILLSPVSAQELIYGDIIPIGANSTVDIRQFRLANGLTVYLNPDVNMPDVYGAIVVKGGSKYDPEGASGTAHYFEHLMFKGTQNLGTVNFREERVYLDSIRSAYDLLQYSKDDELFRKGILRNINRLSQKASEYAIPNEFYRVMSELGCTEINAYTTYENIVYHNHFPRASMMQWINLQVDRFQDPVIRLFQTELETVYEEKNMAMDNVFYKLFREVYQSFYPNSVYGKQSVLGSVEDLKNPSISKLETYFKDYYVANNMALILVGDFDADFVEQSLSKTFGNWRDGQFEKRPDSKESPFNGRVAVKKKLTPVPVGILGFRTVPKGHQDELGLEIIMELLNNSESTGLIDRLVNNQKLMDAGVFSDTHYDIGGAFIYYIPKIFRQSLANGEKLILAQLDSLKQGNFDDEILAAIVVNKRKQLLLQLEDADTRADLIIDAFMSNKNLKDALTRMEQLESMNKSEIIRLANKYFGSDYLAFMSKKGSNKSPKLDKPDFTPLNPKNRFASSELAMKIEQSMGEVPEPDYLDFGNDIKFRDLEENLHFFYTPNPMNNIYTLTYRIGTGSWEKPGLEVLAAYLSKVGSAEKSFIKFRNELQLKGTSLRMWTDKSYFYIRLSGFDEYLASDLFNLKDLLLTPEQKPEVLKQLAAENNTAYRMLKKDVATQSSILNSYALYGAESPYLKRLGKKELKKLTLADLNSLLRDLLTYETEVHYAGALEMEYVSGLLGSYHPMQLPLKRSNSPLEPVPAEITEHEVFFVDNKDALQSHIRLNITSLPVTGDQRLIMPLFNRYYGLGMSSVIFRQVREYNALAYGAYGYLRAPFNFKKPARFDAWMSTQADKTDDALNLLLTLVDSMPEEHAPLEPYKQAFLRSLNAQLPGFRSNSFVLSKWLRQGYKDDPRRRQYLIGGQVMLDEIDYIFGTYIKGRYHRLNIVGDSRRIDMEHLQNDGRFHKLKFKDIYRR